MVTLSEAQKNSILLRDHRTELTTWAVGSGGDANVVIFVHSALLDRHIWNELFSALGSQLQGDWTFLAYDLRGHGSAEDAPPIANVDQLADDLIELAEVLSLKHVHLVGLSLGGAVVQAAAIARPDLISSLIPIGTSSAFPKEIMEKRAELTDGGVAAELQGTLERWFSDGSIAAGGPRIDYVIERVLATKPSVWSGAWLALSKFNVKGVLPTLEMPVLAIGGALDRASPPPVMETIAGNVRNGRLLIVEGASHLVPLEQPQLVATELAGFLRPLAREAIA